MEPRLRRAGFRDDADVICRWIHEESGLVLDVMPTDAPLLGFESRWLAESFPRAVEQELPSGAHIRAIPPPFLLATKVEAFLGRGGGDLIGSRDFTDIVSLVDGREELPDEVWSAPEELRSYLAAEVANLLENERVLDGVCAQLPPDQASQERADSVVLRRLHEIVAADEMESGRGYSSR